jgi:nucleotide-binding universal stress UspA family protein
MGEFLARLNVGGLKLQTIITSSSRPDEAIIALAVAHKVDMVMVGSRGRTSPWDVLLGSTAERIAMHCPLPVLIVKKKGETLDLLKAIMKE